MFESIIDTIYNITGYIIFFVSSYYLLFSIIALKKPKRKYQIVEDKQKFCIFIPCHNEEDVISSTIENLAQIKYDKNLVDFYIIADNCKDNTATIATNKIKELKLSNFIVFERNVKISNKMGKPHALRWAIEQLESKNEFYNKYDQVMILDSDNFVDPNILKEMNSQYEYAKPNKKPCMIQCYLDSKNANSIIAKGYNYSYRLYSNRTPQLSKQRIGSNAIIGGTGYCITTKFLKSIGGFNATSLVEDLEIQTIANIKNEYILYNPHTRIYDEKPTHLKQSYVQKSRWMQGHMFVFFKYFGLRFLSIFKSKSWKNVVSKIDHCIYLSAPIIYVCITLQFISQIIIWVCGFTATFYTLPLYLSLILSLYSLVIYPMVIIKQDGTPKEKEHTFFKLLNIYLSILIASLIIVLSSCRALFTWPFQGKWAKTKHVQTINTNVNQEQTSHESINSKSTGNIIYTTIEQFDNNNLLETDNMDKKAKKQA